MKTLFWGQVIRAIGYELVKSHKQKGVHSTRECCERVRVGALVPCLSQDLMDETKVPLPQNLGADLGVDMRFVKKFRAAANQIRT